MAKKGFRCANCGELFIVQAISSRVKMSCPRCGSKDVNGYNACSLVPGPPPWEFLCRVCRTRFNITAPRGPDEVRQICCPVCLSNNIQWMKMATDNCPATGG